MANWEEAAGDGVLAVGLDEVHNASVVKLSVQRDTRHVSRLLSGTEDDACDGFATSVVVDGNGAQQTGV